MPDTELVERRIRNALWGIFAGDSLSMPVHWYYSRKNIKQDFGEAGITQYEDALHPHPEAFMVGMTYRPDVETATSIGRSYDILGDHARFYDTSYTGAPSIELRDREGEHGNAVADINERFHYHHGLKAGQNTVGAKLVRVLMRSVVEAGRYDQDRFIDDFVRSMTDHDQRDDPYTEIYLRRWFENYSRGIPAEACAENQRRVWSIGSHGGMIRPMVVGLLGWRSPFAATGMALEHQNITHRSENVAAAVAVSVPLLAELVSSKDPTSSLLRASRLVYPPAVTGDELFAQYRDHDGPGNIPDDQMWRLHTDLEAEPLDLERLETSMEEDQVVMGRFATACYPEHGFPLSLYFAHHHRFDVKHALLANANSGGDNVHRGMVLGAIVGAGADEFPEELISGLADRAAIEGEIEAFVDLAMHGSRVY